MSFLRKINRGVILSLAVILAICGYYLAIEIKNRPHRQEITELAKEFSEIWEDGQLRSEEYRDYVVYPEQELEKDAARLRERLKKIYVKDAEGVELWVNQLTTENFYKNSSQQYMESFKVQFKRLYGFTIKDNTATAYMDLGCKAKIHNDPESDMVWERDEKVTGTLSLKLVDGKWKATAISVNSYF